MKRRFSVFPNGGEMHVVIEMEDPLEYFFEKLKDAYGWITRSKKQQPASKLEITLDNITATDARCAVCRQGLEDKAVVCKECKVPYHSDCWQYVGGCSIYGCTARNKASQQ